jgi:hypothetical protein
MTSSIFQRAPTTRTISCRLVSLGPEPWVETQLCLVRHTATDEKPMLLVILGRVQDWKRSPVKDARTDASFCHRESLPALLGIHDLDTVVFQLAIASRHRSRESQVHHSALLAAHQQALIFEPRPQVSVIPIKSICCYPRKRNC